MKIKDTYISFTGELTIGKFAFFMELDSSGVELEIDSLAEQIIHFPRVVIFGNEVFDQKDDIAKLIKKTTKVNTNIIFDIYTIGETKPVRITNMDNINYYVVVRLKASGVSYERRVKENVLNFYNNMKNSVFLFYVNNQDDIDEANLIIQEFTLKKSKVTIAMNHHVSDSELELLLKVCKRNGYNFSINFKNIFWPLIGKTKEEKDE